MPGASEIAMILYLAIAVAVFVYYAKSRNVPWWQTAALALFWPVVFLVYLFNRMTGRPDGNLFTNLGRGRGGRGRGRGRRR